MGLGEDHEFNLETVELIVCIQWDANQFNAHIVPLTSYT